MSLFLDKLLDAAQANGSGRFETKFLVPRARLSQLQHWVATSGLDFRSAYPDRIITSHYLDTWDFRSYADNLDGVSRRVKFRVRHYGESVPEKAWLEAKLRHAQHGYKLRHAIDDKALIARIAKGETAQARGRGGWIQALAAMPKLDSSLAVNLPVLYPAVEITYHRAYYESLTHPVRLTVDQQIRYRRAGHSKAPLLHDPLIVCEIKIHPDAGRHAARMVATIPFRVTRNSKYCRAVSQVCRPLVSREHWERYD